MHWRLIGALFALTLIFTACSTATRKIAGVYTEERRKQILPSVFPSIVALDKFSTFGAGCSGTLIGEDLVLTAGHCPILRFKLGADHLRVRGTPAHSLGEEVDWDGELIPIEFGQGSDWAIARAIWHQGKKPNSPPIARLYTKPLMMGQKVAIIGYPLDRNGVLTESWCDLLESDYEGGEFAPGMKKLVYNCTQVAQNSGGPVIDSESNAIIGVVSGSNPGDKLDPNSIDLKMHSYGVPISEILRQSQVLKNQERVFTGRFNLPGKWLWRQRSEPVATEVHVYVPKDESRSARLEFFAVNPDDRERSLIGAYNLLLEENAKCINECMAVYASSNDGLFELTKSGEVIVLGWPGLD